MVVVMPKKTRIANSGIEKIIQVASTLAIEDMVVTDDIVQNLLEVSQKKKTIDDCIKELDKIYG